jgi:PAS domain S-box-containing protein
LSYALFTPLLVLLADTRSSDARPPLKLRRILLACLINMAIALIAFGQRVVPIPFSIPCVLIVTSLAAGLEATVISLLIDAVIFIAITASGSGPLYLSGSMAFRLMSAQFYVALISFALLPAAAAIAERERLRWNLTRSLARLQQSEAEFRLMAETAADIVVRSDLSGRIEYISPAVEKITGYAAAELIGLDKLPHWSREFAASVHKAISEGLKNPPVSKAISYRITDKNSRDIWLESKPSYIYDDQNRPIAVFNIARDITDRKAVETALIEARDRAEAAALAKAEFLSNMSHELRTPLTSVLGYADLLSGHSGIDQKGKEFVDRIRAAGKALLSTINDVLDYSKLESGQFELVSDTVEVSEHAAQVLDVLSVQANAKHLELVFGCSPGLRGKTFAADPHRLRQVILNLVGNAIKFTEKGRVTLSLLPIERGDGGTYLRYEVSDTGAGIAPEQLDKLFQRFSQVDASSTRRHGGTGLGLAICKAIVEAMEGQIGVTSVLGTGSVFWFEIPFCESDAVPAVQAAALPSQNCARVLVVDDNPANRALVQAALSHVGIEADEAGSGREALALSRDKTYDLILMDVHMPEMDGLAAMRAIRASHSVSAAAPMFAFTAEGDRTRLAGLRSAGFDGIIGKPLNISQLQTMVASAIARSGYPPEEERGAA